LKIIEYILAFIVILSFIPIFNIAIHSYYTVKPIVPPARVQELLFDAVEKTINEQYAKGNLTPEIIDLDGLVREKLGSDILNQYGYRVVIASSIEEVVIDARSRQIVVRTTENYTLRLLILYSDGYIQQLDLAGATSYSDGKYSYIAGENVLARSIDKVDAVVGILESRTARYVGYWFRDQDRVGYALNIDNVLTVAVNSRITLQPLNFYGNQVLNASLIFYNVVTQKFEKYDYKYFELVYLTVLYTTGRKENYLNKTHILYATPYGLRRSYQSYTLFPFRVLRVDIPATRIYQCTDYIFYSCSLRSESSGNPVSSYTPVSYPLYNAVLLSLRDGGGRIIYVPIYRQVYTLGELPSRAEVLALSAYLRIGMFDYNVLIAVWRR